VKTFKIAVIAGDGIGPEVINEGIKVLKKIAELDGGFAFEFTHFPWGCEYYLKQHTMMDQDGMDQLKNFDAIYLGAVGYPGVPDHISLSDLLLRIRKGFDQYVNIRPIKLLEGAPCPLKDVKREAIDMLFIRENSEGEYAGANINPERDYPSMFEPIHGSAPDIAEKGVANPLAAIWSASQMIEFFGYDKLAADILKAIEALLIEEKVLTPDMGGYSSTSKVGDRVVQILTKIFNQDEVKL
jgi:isocitrate/isopropylmalate dehydrogenase